MDSKIKIVAMVALVLIVGLAFWFVRGMPGEPEETPSTAGANSADRSAGAAVTPTPAGGGTHTQQDQTGPDRGETVDPDLVTRGASVEERGEAQADAAGEGIPDDTRIADYVHAPLPALQTRIQAATLELPEGRQIRGVTILCLTGGADCRVTGVAAVPMDVRTFAENIEVAPAVGDEEQAPTVEVNSTESMSSGMTDFEMGVYYP